jgi:hypothetical protein
MDRFLNSTATAPADSSRCVWPKIRGAGLDLTKELALESEDKSCAASIRAKVCGGRIFEARNVDSLAASKFNYRDDMRDWNGRQNCRGGCG